MLSHFDCVGKNDAGRLFSLQKPDADNEFDAQISSEKVGMSNRKPQLNL